MKNSNQFLVLLITIGLLVSACATTQLKPTTGTQVKGQTNDYQPNPIVNEPSNNPLPDQPNAAPDKDTPQPNSLGSSTKTFDITAKSWSFEPDTITVNKGDTVVLNIQSIDVHHGFALPDFNVNVDLQPQKKQTVQFVADKTGTYTFFCNVFCGEGHRGMKGQLIVQ